MDDLSLDSRVRLAAFRWLEEQSILHADVLPSSVLVQGFVFEGVRVPLVSPQGIFKPRVLPWIPLSIRTGSGSPYDDAFGPDDLLRYAYRGTDPAHRENAGLREAMRREVPLVYFHAVAEGRYLAAWPVFIVGDDPIGLRFTVALDDVRQLGRLLAPEDDRFAARDAAADAAARRTYVTAALRVRLHQRGFRERVVRAYRSQCALCRLRHDELLDAAHIVPDLEGRGEPIVPNGLALCKLHHAAFDRHFLTVRPDYVIEVRRDILDEEDGPMLLHGLKGMHGARIVLPRAPAQQPDRDRLAWRYERFRRTG